MADDKRINRRQSMDALFGADAGELSEEFFEEKLKEMGDAPKVTKGMALKHRRLDEDTVSMAESAERGRVVRDDKMSALFGADDIVPDEAEFEEKLKKLEEKQETAPEKELSEYERWLEEGLKNDKGYGTKVAYTGEVTEEPDSYAGSTHESYDKWQAETQELIRNLKRRDARVKARDDNIHDALYLTSVMKGGAGMEHTGDGARFLDIIAALAWYLLFAFAFVGLFKVAGGEDMDLWAGGGIGGVVGAIVRYNGRQDYPLWQALQKGAVEVAMCIAFMLCWILNCFASMNFMVVMFIGGIFAGFGLYLRERLFEARPAKEALYRCLPIFIVTPALILLVALVVVIFQDAGL